MTSNRRDKSSSTTHWGFYSTLCSGTHSDPVLGDFGGSDGFGVEKNVSGCLRMTTRVNKKEKNGNLKITKKNMLKPSRQTRKISLKKIGRSYKSGKVQPS